MQKRGMAAAIVAFAITAAGGASAPADTLRQAVDEQIKQLPPGVTATYASIEGSTIKGVSLHVLSDQGTADVTVGEIDLANPNLDLGRAWGEALADPKALSIDTVIPLYDSATLKDVTIEVTGNDPPVTMSSSLGSFTSKGGRLYPWAFSQPGVPSLAELQALLANAAAMPQSPEALMPAFHFAAAVGMSYADDGSAIENMKLAIKPPPMSGTDAPEEIAYEIKNSVSAGLDRGIAKGVVAEGVSVTMGSQGSISVERVSEAGFDLRKSATAALMAQDLTPDMLDGMEIGRIEYKGVTMTPPRTSEWADYPPILLASFTISDIAFSGAVPISAGFSLDGLKMSLSQLPLPDPDAKQSVEDMGIDMLTIGIGAAYEWDLAKKRIKLHDVVLKVDELGSLAFSAEVAEIAPDWAGAIDAKLAYAELRYNDASLADRVIKLAAGQQQQDPAAFRQQLTGMVQMMSAQFTSDSPPLAAASQAVVDFLNAPKSLTVELRPSEPLSIMQLTTIGDTGVLPAQVATMLGLAVTANK